MMGHCLIKGMSVFPLSLSLERNERMKHETIIKKRGK